MTAPARGLPPAGFVQRQRKRGDSHERNRTECERRESAQRQCERYDDAIQPDLLQSRKTARTEEHEEAHRSPCQQQADGRTGNRQKRALGQEVARNAAVARADSSADRDVTLACLGANKEEVRDVRAANQQHKTDGRQENP